MRRSCCCCTASRAPATCSATSSRCWPIGFTSSRPICPASASPTCRIAAPPSTISPDAIDRFTDIVGFDRFAIYVFDYGAPTGFRLAVRHPDRITAIISQNGNAYEEGLSDGWNPIRAYWQDASQANRDALRAFLTPETTVWQYTHGVPDATTVSPDGYSLDNFYLAGPALMSCSSTCSATTKATSRSIPPSRSISATTSRRCWRCGARTTRSSCRPGAEAFKRDMPDAVVRFFDTGHFALETHAAEIAAAIRDFLPH